MIDFLMENIEKHLIWLGDKNKKLIDKSIERKLNYKQHGSWEDMAPPFYVAFKHYSNEQMDEGLIYALGVELKTGSVIGGNIFSQATNRLSFYGYGESWKKMKSSRKDSFISKYRKKLNVPKDREILVLNPKKVIKFLEIKLPDSELEFKPPKPKEIPPYIS